jgi:3-hydroxybutyryl-CoA dehydrogenase
MVLGLNHPRGPLEWSALIGLDHVVAVLEALHHAGGDAYRLAPALRRADALGLTFGEAEPLD